jgi:hypothetical protein
MAAPSSVAEKSRLLVELAIAEERIAIGKAKMSLQRDIIERLRRRGADTRLSKEILNNFEKAQAHMIEHRDLLIRLLEEN